MAQAVKEVGHRMKVIGKCKCGVDIYIEDYDNKIVSNVGSTNGKCYKCVCPIWRDKGFVLKVKLGGDFERIPCPKCKGKE